MRITFALACLALCACGTEKAEPAADADAGASADTSADAVADAAADVATGPLVKRWTTHANPVAGKLRAVAAVPGKPGSYVAVGDAANVVRLDGNQLASVELTQVGTANLHSVWIAPDGAWFVAGDASTLLRHDDKGWVLAGEVPPTPAVQFNGIAGTSGQDVWAVGGNRAVWHHDGTTWLATDVTPTAGVVDLPLGVTASYTCVATRSPGDVWIGVSLAQGGAVLHGLAGKWTAIVTDSAPAAIWPAEDGKVFIAGGTNEAYVAILQGGSFVKQDKIGWSQGFNAIAGLSATQVWAAGTKGQLRFFDGTAWKVDDIKAPFGTKPADVFAATETLQGIALHAADERAVISNSALYRWAKQPL